MRYEVNCSHCGREALDVSIRDDGTLVVSPPEGGKWRGVGHNPCGQCVILLLKQIPTVHDQVVNL